MPSDGPYYWGWGTRTAIKRGLKRAVNSVGLLRQSHRADQGVYAVVERITETGWDTTAGKLRLAGEMAFRILWSHTSNPDDINQFPIFEPLVNSLAQLIAGEGWWDVPAALTDDRIPKRSEIWDAEDEMQQRALFLDQWDAISDNICRMYSVMLSPLLRQHPSMVELPKSVHRELRFSVSLVDHIHDLPSVIEGMTQFPYAPEFDDPSVFPRLRARLEHNLVAASGGQPGEPFTKQLKGPDKQGTMPAGELVATYLEGTPFTTLFDGQVPITISPEIRFQHHHMVAGSGHGKTQTLQFLIDHDLQAVSNGEASIVVIDSQSDLINNIAGLKVFGPGYPMEGRLVVIDPTDLEWPVALNLFDVGLDRLDQYSELDCERLTNSIIELYDFVLGSLLDAGMTQKQTIIFRYITRLLLHIPGATIHTLRELLEEDGYDKYYRHIQKLQGSARAFFENEFQGREFTGTKKQVLRRLYGILENQTFERMFSHPKSKLDLFAEMNAGKVILINTAKDLLKENGTEIFGRFFIAMIAQAAQERAVLSKEERLPTYVYIDEASDYFDRNIGIILSQARKYNVGMILAHQFLSQLDSKLYDAISANTAIKFAGGASAKDARAMAAELRTDPGFIESQPKLSFAAMIKGETKQAVSLPIIPGVLESKLRMSEVENDVIRGEMREKYAVHHSEISLGADYQSPSDDEEPDNGEPMKW